MLNHGKIFEENEIRANIYVANCLLVAAAISVVMWILNVLEFFIVDKAVMNIAMFIGILFFLFPSILVKGLKIHSQYMKYFSVTCFVIGVAIMYSGCTYHAILAWACPIVLSCHYYSKEVTRYTLKCVLVFMLISLYVGLYFGVWDNNITLESEAVIGHLARLQFFVDSAENGTDILERIFKLFYVSRAIVVCAVYSICSTLSSRTRLLIETQQQSALDRERISAEFDIASDIQNAMLPERSINSPYAEYYDLCASMTPSKEVGGDFYDFFIIDDDHLALVIADVSGKGVPAAMFMMATTIMIKNQVLLTSSPSKALYEVNNQLCENNENDMFVTVWLGIYEISTGKLTACNAGHEYPVHKPVGKDFGLLHDKHGFVLGGMEGMRYKDYELQLEVGDVLFVYTDGVAEAIDDKNLAYGTDRLVAKLNELHDQELSTVLYAIKNDVDRFSNGVPQFDDITMLSIKRRK